MRKNYVYYYNGAFYSFITESKAMPFTPDMINIKDRAISKDYKILKYSIIFEDEKQLSGKLSTNWQSYAKADSGASDFLRTIRHLGKGTIYYITTSQEFGADEIRERKLATSIIYVKRLKKLNPYYLQRFFLSIAKDLIMYLIDFKGDFRALDDLERFYGPSGTLKRALFIINQKRKLLESRSFLRYKIIKYNSAEDVGKRLALTAFGAEECTLTFPIKYCFGSINTYQFGVIQDYLENISGDINLYQEEKEKKNDQDLAKAILAKKEIAKKPKKEAD